MRKICTLIGVGKRKQGISKAGNPYDFTPIALSFDDKERWDRGSRVTEVNASTEEIFKAAPQGLNPGDVVEVVMHEDYRRGGFVLDAIL